MTLKLAQFCDDPKKISTKSSYPQKIFIFLKTKKNIEIQNFEPKKMVRAYVYVKISEYPPGVQARLSLHLSKCHIVGNHMSRHYISQQMRILYFSHMHGTHI